MLRSRAFGHPLQRREPKIVTAVHTAFVGLSELRHAFSDARLFHNDKAAIGARLQEPGVVERRLGAERVPIPTEPRVAYILVYLALDGEAKRRPAPPHIRAQYFRSVEKAHVLRVWIPLRPAPGVNNVIPDGLAGCPDH